ncbi:hypothetical protein B9Z19DRAFT_1084880 [Tuber borchii]|uniref:Uncharacterized protein n=1 Tax=Tuber borchii TaxID=42251 RepID=A0A2T6ZRC5_TUBBO|nr:hypothetical protein B9Z19DRAFT_1084880 [Tuber borchii]
MKLSSRSFSCSFARGLFLWLGCYRCCCRATHSQRLLSRPHSLLSLLLPCPALPAFLFDSIPITFSLSSIPPTRIPSTSLLQHKALSIFHHLHHPPPKAPSTSSATITNSFPHPLTYV